MDLTKTLKPRTITGKNGQEELYYTINFEIALLFGLTEFKANVIWQENVSSESLRFKALYTSS